MILANESCLRNQLGPTLLLVESRRPLKSLRSPELYPLRHRFLLVRSFFCSGLRMAWEETARFFPDFFETGRAASRTVLSASALVPTHPR